jgi:uncharacterized membrane protein YfcA
MDQLTLTHWLLLGAGALFTGLGKGGLPGAGNLTVAIFALVFEGLGIQGGVALSVGILLPILISADIAAVSIYRRHADWKYIARLLPFFVVGIVAGWFVFDYFKARGELLKTAIGWILLVMTGLHFFRKWQKRHEAGHVHDPEKPHHLSLPLGILFGLLGGIATMLANAAGPVAQLSLLAMALPKYAFIGTAAWLFLIVNVFKVPFMVDLGIINTSWIKVSFFLMPFAVAATFFAPVIVKRINQKLFEFLLWAFVVFAGIKLVA